MNIGFKIGGINTGILKSGVGGGLTSNTIVTEDIDDEQITYSKIQNTTQGSVLLGRITGAGVVEELTPSDIRTLINVEDGSTSNSINSVLTDRSNHTGTQVLSTISDADSATQTLTNKTLDSTTNSITSDSLRYSGGSVNISSSSAPAVDDIMTATSSTTGVWKVPDGKVNGYFVSESDTVTTTSDTFNELDDMVIVTPDAGKYLVRLIADGKSSKKKASVQIRINGVSGSESSMYGNNTYNMAAQAEVTVNGSENIIGEFRIYDSGTAYITTRSLSAIKMR